MMKKKYKVWRIEGYTGCSDYDGPQDDNHHEDLIFDGRYTKKGVIQMWMSAHDNGGYVAVSKCELIAEGEIEINTGAL